MYRIKSNSLDQPPPRPPPAEPSASAVRPWCPPIAAPSSKRFDHPPSGAVSLLSCHLSRISGPSHGAIVLLRYDCPAHGAVVPWHFDKPHRIAVARRRRHGDNSRSVEQLGTALRAGLSKRLGTTAPCETMEAPQEDGAVEVIVEARSKRQTTKAMWF